MLFTLTAGVTLSTLPQPYLWKGAPPAFTPHPPPQVSRLGKVSLPMEELLDALECHSLPASFSEAPKSAPLLQEASSSFPSPGFPLPLGPTFFFLGVTTFRDPCHPS